MVSFTSRSLYPGEGDPGTLWIGGWVGPRAGLDIVRRLVVHPVAYIVIKHSTIPYFSVTFLVGYLTTLTVSGLHSLGWQENATNWKGFGRKRRWSH
jgi:hypothetical protein